MISWLKRMYQYQSYKKNKSDNVPLLSTIKQYIINFLLFSKNKKTHYSTS